MLDLSVVFIISGLSVTTAIDQDLFGPSKTKGLPDRLHAWFSTKGHISEMLTFRIAYMLFSIPPNEIQPIKPCPNIKLPRVTMSSTVLGTFTCVIVALACTLFILTDNVDVVFWCFDPGA